MSSISFICRIFSNNLFASQQTSLSIGAGDAKGARLAAAPVVSGGLTLPMHAPGLATFDLGATEFVWDPLPDPSAPT